MESVNTPLFPSPLTAERDDVTVHDAVTGSLIPVTINRWEPPGQPGVEVVVSLSMACPNCRYPMNVPVKGAFVVSDEGQITLRQEVKCHGHWAPVDDRGLVDDEGHKHCGWSCVIRYGIAHQRDCIRADFIHAHPRGLGGCGVACDLTRHPQVEEAVHPFPTEAAARAAMEADRIGGREDG